MLDVPSAVFSLMAFTVAPYQEIKVIRFPCCTEKYCVKVEVFELFANIIQIFPKTIARMGGGHFLNWSIITV